MIQIDQNNIKKPAKLKAIL